MSNASMLERLSCNIFITNFPAYFSSKDLWNTCSKFGTVLDVFIPSKVSKQGKRYAFARFKKVSNVDSLISNLRSVWLGSFHLYANVARFNRDTKTSDAQNSHSNVPLNTSKPSYAKVLGKKESPQNHDEPVIVLEEGMLNFEGEPVLVGCVKDFKSLSNLQNVFYSEGFNGIKITYLGSFWVMMEFDSFQSCDKFRTHESINSWFSSLSPWSPHFEVQDRIVWIDVEGIPLRAWSKTTFNKIARKWGELVFMDDSNSANKYSMRLCVKTTFFHLIAESFKVIIKGKVYVVRAKEVTGWVPDFGEENSDESEDYSDNNSVGKKNWVESEEGEIIPESVQNDAFIDNIVESEPNNRDSRENQSGQHILKPSNHPSGDPFGLEDLICKSSKKSTKVAHEMNDSNPKFPPGFTPQHSDHSEYEKVEALRASTPPQDSKKVRNDQTFHQVLEESVNKSSGVSKTAHADSMAGPVKQRNGFSILERFQEFIDIGQAMGYEMKGCEKDFRRIITSLGDVDTFK
ncbi:RNA-directed DNA polymerase, eukaryota, reverse transcriptase zinc-binding domain protein [Tanacetum coccineum]